MWIGWKELRIRAASVAQRCPNALLYHSGVLPLKRSAECYHTDVYSLKKKMQLQSENSICVCVCVCVCACVSYIYSLQVHSADVCESGLARATGLQ